MKLFSSLLLAICSIGLFAQQQDSLFIRKIYDEALTKGECYENLRVLCKDIGHRLSGSPAAEKAVVWGEKVLSEYGFKVRLQEVMVPKWVRGKTERCEIAGPEPYPLHVSALGGSVGTDGELTAPVIEVTSFDQLEELGEKHVKGKIVFFNTPMEKKFIKTFHAYGGCHKYRSKGPAKAGELGAVGTVLRSLSLKSDHAPHTGAMHYKDGIPKVPCVAIGNKDADILSEHIQTRKDVKITMDLQCETLPNVKSYNVIGEWQGTENPDKFMVVGGHLDSWDIGEGAHDDGAGIVHSIEAMRILKAIGYKPKNTIRVVLFMNEENGNNGGKKYAKEAAEKGENHYAAIESDAGGFTPRGFSVDGSEANLKQLQSWSELLAPYHLKELQKGWGGVDIGPLKSSGTVLFGYRPDSQRYFDFHHAPTDVFENVHKRELELGSASIAALIYLLDKYGVTPSSQGL